MRFKLIVLWRNYAILQALNKVETAWHQSL